MNETTERFLQEIATRVGYDRVAELYLFPVLRQGGVEGAVAVVAAHPEVPETVEGSRSADSAEAAEPVEAAVATEPSEAASEAGAAGEPGSEAGEAAGERVDENVEQDADEDITPADDAATEDAAAASGDEVPAEASIDGARESRVRARHVVYTARYRHTIKGPDRGRWAVEVVAEADAPLITVEEVVRGVVRRSGDEFQPERLSGEQFRALVPAPAAPGSAPA